jgi:adenine C2-methylase RlmN of 23S rRNA A2503 and tRNA A37
MKVLQSQTDLSRNFIENALEGFIESRYVRRSDKYFVCYLSSHNGCNRGCQMCHLTATGQTMFAPATIADYIEQARRVFAHYREAVESGAQKPAEYMHYAFMARGEPLANPMMLARGQTVLSELGELASEHDLPTKFCISTIMPKTLRGPLHECFGYIQPTLYYSIYSVQQAFREKWLPGAMDVDRALDMLAAYQQYSKKIVKLHFAFIEGENDGADAIGQMCTAIEVRNLICEVNIVRYNPATTAQGLESSEGVIDARVADLRACPVVKAVKIVQRVGYDVKASCGMFVDKE